MPLEFAELEIYRHPVLMGRLARLRRAVSRPLGPLTVTVATSPEPVPFEDRHGLRYRPARAGTPWGTAFTCAWFHVTGEVPADARRPVLLLDTDGEALVRDGAGAVVGAVTSRVTPVELLGATRGKTRLDLTPELIPGGRIDLWLDAGFNGKLMPPFGHAMVKRLSLVEWDDDAAELYHDALTCVFAALGAPEETLRRRYHAALAAVWALPAATSASEIAAARGALEPLLRGTPDASLRVTAVGHGHLDLAWLWPLRETRRKAERTLTHQLDLIDRHPGHRYGVSQPQQLAWLADRAPELYRRVQDAVASGRVEAQGGMWVEADTNLPSGESLVRQILVGQRFWQREFGVRPTVCWLPDVFGYNANLPQLLTKGGMRHFLTIKLSWNEHNDFPHRSFVWQGVDGSEVLVHMPPEGSYNSSASPLALSLARRHYPEADAAPEALLVYGSGDGGGGPGETHLALLNRARSLEGYPPVEHGTAAGFFAALERDRERLPRHAGELYLEKHQGTFTTQAANKRLNRRLESRLHDVEYLGALAWAAGGEYPAALLDEAWRDVLLFQFHDIIPGSSIGRVHRESVARYRQLEDALVAEQDRLLAASGEPVFVNTQPVPRSGWTPVAGRWYGYRAAAHQTVPLEPWRPGPDDPRLTGDTLENEHLRARFGPDGSLVSLVDLASGRESCGEYLNRLVVHRDPWSYFDAWDINPSYLRREPAVLRPASVQTLRDGPRAIRRTRYRYGRSTIVSDAVLAPGQRALVFEMRVDWHATWRMLRAEFRPRAWAGTVACDIQFGHFRRSTRDETPTERAQYEICAHRWVDVSTEGPDAHGFSLLNDSKYGHRVKDGLISLNLLRSPVYPDAHADRGRHEFRYAVYPHEGGLGSADTVGIAYDLNAPVVVAAGRPAALPEVAWRVEGGGVLLETVKRAEDGQGLILRLYEWAGVGATVRLASPLPVASIVECNLLEEPLSGVPLDADALRFGPFELRTLLVTLRN